MQLGITIPLQKHLKCKAVTYGEPADLFYCWELHIIKIQGRNTLAMVNANNRFAIILWGMKAAHWKKLEIVSKEAIEQGFLSEGYKKEQIESYFKYAGEIVLTKTHGRSPVSTLNKMIEYLQFIPVQMDGSVLYQAVHSHSVNRDLCHASGYEDYGYPVEFLESDMKRFGIL